MVVVCEKRQPSAEKVDAEGNFWVQASRARGDEARAAVTNARALLSRRDMFHPKRDMFHPKSVNGPKKGGLA